MTFRETAIPAASTNVLLQIHLILNLYEIPQVFMLGAYSLVAFSCPSWVGQKELAILTLYVCVDRPYRAAFFSV